MNPIPPLMPYGPPCGHTSIILGLSRQLFQKRPLPQSDEADALADAIGSAPVVSVLLHGCTEYSRVLSSCFPSHGLRFVSEGPSGIASAEGRGETYLQSIVSGFESLSATQETPFSTLESLDNAIKASIHPISDTKCDDEDEVAGDGDASKQQPDQAAQDDPETDLKQPPAKRRAGSRKKLRENLLLQQQQQQYQRAILESTVLKGEEGSTTPSLRHRVILVLPLSQNTSNESELEMHTLADGSTVDVRRRFNDIATQESKTPWNLFVVRVKTSPSIFVQQNAQGSPARKGHAVVELNDFPAYMASLSAQQCCLMKVVVSGINVRMLNPAIAGSSSPIMPGTASFWAQGFPEHAVSAPVGMNLSNSNQVELVLKWNQPCDSMTTVPAPDALPCNCIHRATPAFSDDPVSQILWSHVLSGKSVLLGTEGSKVTHSLQVHANGVVYMHCHRDVELALTDTICGEDGPLAFDCAECKNYPTRDFFELIDSNLLFHKRATESVPDLTQVVVSDKEGPALTPILAERYTRFFPWDDKYSIIQGKETYEELKNLLDQIRKVVTLPKIDPPAFALGKYSFERLADSATNNSPKLFPPLRSSAAARKKAYQKLCEEVYLFARNCDTTPEHHSFVELLESLLPSELLDRKKVSLSPLPEYKDCKKSEPTPPRNEEDGEICENEDESTEKQRNRKSLFGDRDSLLSVFWSFKN